MFPWDMQVPPSGREESHTAWPLSQVMHQGITWGFQAAARSPLADTGVASGLIDTTQQIGRSPHGWSQDRTSSVGLLAFAVFVAAVASRDRKTQELIVA
ncbi:hypothetical protein P3102_24110 [Amycolatopsis sp. QT-25]|uniref:hypothetical protein n=1 Tax=Amycolatopsis sp. QT-25 TaxID=3034022 RepID=UPI0023EDA541|nr:hypothetical protein [Amycolatopsis sp. QT-25]WET77168.1 hypothetical protein P3102_24110 [Amycolatopsis sp. QT-25]